MKTQLFACALVALLFISADAQTAKKQTGQIARKTASPIISSATVSEISELEWTQIVKSLESENWTKAANLSQTALKKMKSDNEKKQLARLRYFYLYSLAGKVALKTMLPSELENISQAFIGQEFLMPSREVLADCTEKVNYVCPVKSDENSLRITATNKTASVINAFEYVKTTEKFDFTANDAKKVFIGGKLKKLEVGDYKNNMKIAKFYFEEGTVEILKS